MASSLALIGGNSLVWADEKASSDQVKIQRSFINFNFNHPNITSGSSGHKQFNEGEVDGWRTTHKLPKLIEMWKGKGPDTNATTAWGTANNGNQYAELNAEYASALYQPVCFIKNEEFEWDFKHARRSNNAEQAGLIIGRVNKNTATSSNGDTYVSYQEIGKSPTALGLFSWRNVNPEKTKAKVTVDTGNYDLLFAALNSQNKTLGNFIDDIVIRLKPAVEFSTQSDKYYEGGEQAKTYRSLAFNMVGHITSQSEMPLLQFQIEYPQDYIGSKAVYGVNYELYKKEGGEFIKLDARNNALDLTNPNKITFNYTPIYSATLDYSKGVKIENLYIKILGNNVSNADMQIPFAFTVDANSNVVPTNLKLCGDELAVKDFNFVIQEDDIDLEVKKQLTPDSIPVKDQLVSYFIDVSNNTQVPADGVLLKDILGTTLQRVTAGVNQTRLVCEDLTSGKSESCPASWIVDENAINSLLDSTAEGGLNLGTVPANAKYRFTLQNLKVIDPQGTGFIKNTAEVITTLMQDIKPENNISTVESRIIGPSDLSNHKMGAAVTETGVGLFYIGQEGRSGITSLLTKRTDSSGKVFFPLNIQNSSDYSQNYTLYTSSTAIETVSEGDYSSLDTSSISSFLTGLRIKFYPVNDNACKAELTSGDITHIEVAAGKTAQVCAEITVNELESDQIPIWFAIQSAETGLGDIIKNSVEYTSIKNRFLELLNDQKAQVSAGGTFVFLHRLLNKGNIDEENIAFKVLPLKQDGFLYTLFVDTNNNGELDTSDMMLTSLDQTYNLPKDQALQILLKVESPSTATNGMMSQVMLEAIPSNLNQTILLESLINTDMVFVGSNQVQVTKMQYKRSQCVAMTAEQIKTVPYSIASETIGANDCLIYRVSVKNIGSERLENIDVNDMYPAYTKKWEMEKNILPMTSDGDTVESQSDQVKTTLKELLPQQEKSLYFGIRLH